MNITRVRIGVSAVLLVLSTGASAQSSVTLFGSLDEGLNITSNAAGSRAYQMSSIDVQTSRWGIKGKEDIGDGLHAFFDLESGVNLESGTSVYPGRLFGYQSYIGMKSDNFGKLTIGRQFDTISDTVGRLTANGNWAGYLFAHPLDNDNTDGTFHTNNSIKFTSQTYGGISATGLYGFSNQEGGFSENRIYGVGLNYVLSDLNMSAVYEDLTAPGTTSGGSIAAGDEGFVAANQKILGVGAGYKIGQVAFDAVYTHVILGQAVSSIYVNALGLMNPDMNLDNIELNTKYFITPSLFIGGMYTYTRANVQENGGMSSIHWNQAGLMAQYNLSARTAVYSQFVYQRVTGGPDGVLSFAYIPGSAGVSSEQQQMVLRIGITQSF
jgi:predicted porin